MDTQEVLLQFYWFHISRFVAVWWHAITYCCSIWSRRSHAYTSQCKVCRQWNKQGLYKSWSLRHILRMLLQAVYCFDLAVVLLQEGSCVFVSGLCESNIRWMDSINNIIFVHGCENSYHLLFMIVIEAIPREFRDVWPWELLYADDMGVSKENCKGQRL